MNYPEAFLQLLDCFKHLPGVGAKSAERLVYHVLNMKDEYIEEFADALVNLKSNIHFCEKCGHLSDEEMGEMCSNETRDHSTIMIVEKPQDVYAMEKIKEYKGVYHVLHGVVSMMDGIGIEDLNIKPLLKRLDEGSVKEVIVATNLTREGETTALYLGRILQEYNVSVTRIARGLPIGGNIDYADELTLIKSLEGRTKF